RVMSEVPGGNRLGKFGSPGNTHTQPGVRIRSCQSVTDLPSGVPGSPPSSEKNSETSNGSGCCESSRIGPPVGENGESNTLVIGGAEGSNTNGAWYCQPEGPYGIGIEGPGSADML